MPRKHLFEHSAMGYALFVHVDGGHVATAAATQTYLPTGQTDQVAQVLSFLQAHAARGGERVPRYYLVGDDEGEQVELPKPIYQALLQVADALASGKAVTVAPESTLLTTQQAADLLGVSRPTVVRLIDGGELAAERHGNRRRVLLRDLLAYRERRRYAQYEMLASTSIEIGDEDDIEAVRESLRAARRHIAAQRRSS